MLYKAEAAAITASNGTKKLLPTLPALLLSLLPARTAAPCISVLIDPTPPPLAVEKAATSASSSVEGTGLAFGSAGAGEAFCAAGDGDWLPGVAGAGLVVLLLPAAGGLGDAAELLSGAGAGDASGDGLGGFYGGLPMTTTGLSTAVVSGSIEASGTLHRSSEQQRTFK
jgi:hypothetical protein